ncbi:DUF6029 family protein [Aureispira sp. CCB-E]|uniref:DUF6029 family protein n=1 Tax=Aureispira sp. CCB-E TaxID=3051121 RepID=UPI002868C5B7|nr:DUF6029 family protein [Aureispira sp. CCB-E]WMX16497.1 DUF6029 family protein [Aureispira sp. CCB-E]
MRLRMIQMGLLMLCFFINKVNAQNDGNQNKFGTLTGDFETQNSFFIRDSIIGAANTPQYDRQKFGTNNWLTLNYNVMGFDIGIRFDAYYNSNLIDPLDSYSALGLGRWHIRKEIFGLDITAGYFYDQIGNGTIFRAYNERYLPIDNALVGARLIYKINDNWQAKAFVGQQKKVEKQLNLFENYQPIIAGAAIDGYIPIGKEDNQVILTPGAGAVRRTLDDASMNQIATDISSYASEDVFVPKYTTYAFSVYNNLTWKGFNWYIEGAYKTAEAVNALNPKGILENKDGTNIFTTLSYSMKGFSILGQYKRTDHFIFRTSPLQTLNRGLIAFLPPMARQNTYRLSSRYNAATQDVGEQAGQLDVTVVPIPKKLTLNLNLSNIYTLEPIEGKTGDEAYLLYREVNLNGLIKLNKKMKLIAGFQFQQYNQERYEQKPGVPIVTTYVPYAEFRMRMKKRKSLRVELSYMHTEEDYGSWAFALFEFNVKDFSFWASAMINTVPKKYDNIEVFYEFGANYTHKSNKFELGYKRQVEGIVCTGGVCRYQPAFNGVQLNVVSSF